MRLAGVVRSVGTAVALALTVGIGPAAAVEGDGIRLDPATDESLGDGSAFRPALLPGASASYDLLVTNRRDETVEVLVYAADAPDGEVADGTSNRDVGTWITFDEQRLGLAPDDAATVTFTVTRPDDDELGGTAAVVVQLSDGSRTDLGLAAVERAALLVEVAPDARGSGIHAVVTDTRRSPGVVPGTLEVDVLLTDPQAGPVAFDGSLVLDGPLGTVTAPLPVDTVDSETLTTVTVGLDLPWYGAVGQLRAVAAVPGVETSSAPVRLVVVPPWLVALLLLLALRATVRERRRRRATTQ